MSDLTTPGAARKALAILAAGGLLTAGIAAASPSMAAERPTTDSPAADSGVSALDATSPADDPVDGPVKGSGTPQDDALGELDRERLAAALQEGETRTTIMVVTKPGASDDVVKSIRAAGGYVRFHSAKLSYLSAVVRTTNVAKTADLSTVLAVDLDETLTQPDPIAQAGGTQYDGPDASTRDNNPYMPTRETGSVAFKRANPMWDGRGVTVGILDSGVDLDHPSLATTSTGEKKISDWFTATDPVTEGEFVPGGDPTWLAMIQDAEGPTFPAAPGSTYRGSVWTLPAGAYKIRTVDESRTDLPGCEICGDLNRDGDTTDRIGVLYSPTTKEVWVDTDDDKTFTDETAMTRYRDSGQVGHLGTDRRGTDVRESIPFVVDYREGVDYSSLGASFASYTDITAVDIGISSGAHGSHVAGIVAANDLFGGRSDGQAPGAKLVSARACTFGAGCTAAALTDGMAELAANRGVDLINMSIGGLPALNDGDNARARLYNTIINELGVQLVISAGNSGAALNTIGDPSVATDVVSVGADITRETWAANYGSEVDFDENMLPFSSGGPREDGGFKPNITAPGSAISTTPLWLPGVAVAEAGYDLPAGYSMFNGTSMAAPQAAGGMTLLLSAARQSGVGADSPAALRKAVYSSAVYNEEIPAFLQGHGQIDVPRAWRLFSQNLTTTNITTSAPVCTEVWNILGNDSGTGLYNRCAAGAGGQAPDSRRNYVVTFTRTSGDAAPIRHRLRLRGDDGTFSLSQSSVRLALNTPVSIRVTAAPSAGAHTAVLDIDDPSSAGIEESMMLAVVASDVFPENNTLDYSGVSQRNEAQRFYITVPEGVTALELGMSGLDEGSQTRFIAFSPYGQPIDNTSTIACYPNYGDPVGNGCNPATRSYANPIPGVWELLVESRRTSPLLDNPFELTAKLIGATVDPATVTLDSVAKGVATPVEWTVTNEFADVTASAVGGPLGSSLTRTPTIGATGDDLVYTVEVPEGASRLDVSIGGTSDQGADLDLFVDGPSGPLSSADGDSEESVTYTDPQPGTYTVRVDNYDVPAGTTTFTYRDVFYSSALGELAVDSTPFDLPTGATRTIAGTVTAAAAPTEGRELFGSMSVTSSSGTVLGTGNVLIKAVTG